MTWPAMFRSAYVFDARDALLGWVSACEDRGYRVTVLGQGDRLDRYGEVEMPGVAARFPTAKRIETGGEMVDLEWAKFSGERRIGSVAARARVEAAGERRCTVCEVVLPLAAFRFYRGRYYSQCKPCESAKKCAKSHRKREAA